MKYIENDLSKVIKNPVDYEKARTNFALKKLIGIDFNPALVRVSKMRMILEEDGHTGIFQANSLENFESLKKSAKTASSLSVDKSSVQIILTKSTFWKEGKSYR